MNYSVVDVIEVVKCNESKPKTDSRGIAPKSWYVELQLEGQTFSGNSKIELPVGYNGKVQFVCSSSPTVRRFKDGQTKTYAGVIFLSVENFKKGEPVIHESINFFESSAKPAEAPAQVPTSQAPSLPKVNNAK